MHKRIAYAVLLLVTIALGLASRHGNSPLPWWLAKNAGDILYATMTFWLAGLVRPELSRSKKALAAVLFCYTIEAAKLIQAPLLVAARADRIGHLLLGTGFQASNLVCYLVGAVLAAGLDWLIWSRLASRPEDTAA